MPSSSATAAAPPRRSGGSGSGGLNVVVTGSSGMLGAHIVEVDEACDDAAAVAVAATTAAPTPHPPPTPPQLLLTAGCIGPTPISSIVAFDLKPFVRLNTLEWEAAAAAEAKGVLLRAGAAASAKGMSASSSSSSTRPAISSIVGDIRNRSHVASALQPPPHVVIHTASVVDFGNSDRWACLLVVRRLYMCIVSNACLHVVLHVYTCNCTQAAHHAMLTQIHARIDACSNGCSAPVTAS